MPRPKGDHEARRRDVSEAVWKVLTTRGFGGLTLRAIAAELGATTGLLTHYFPSKRDLVAYALALLTERTIARPRRETGPGMAAVRNVLLHRLPLTDEARDINRIWVSSWDTALADPAISADYETKYAQTRENMRELIVAAQELGEFPDRDPARVAAGAIAFTTGLIVQALFSPTAFPPHRLVELLDDYLDALNAPLDR
ncbi:TetR/AcrR family transcriptional regulator [Nocardia altamirensis]|uniref:TetR/AcrR family transcriptional regulator n=1 Tax=Nocardia altamirensis TaxID=472158 RepID=UPI00083FF4A5|nr:TetR/AcrR family transcriptional regulator [Nocardia altamirensis]